MKLRNFIAIGAALVGLTIGSNAESKKSDLAPIFYYSGTIDDKKVFYTTSSNGPDILEVYDNRKEEYPPLQEYAGITSMAPIAEIFNDYDKNGTIGNHPKDRYVFLFGKPTSGKHYSVSGPFSSKEFQYNSIKMDNESSRKTYRYRDIYEKI